MLEINNRTSFKSSVVPGMDKDGHDYAAVIIKGTFAIQSNNRDLTISDEQVPINFEDIFFGEPGQSSIKYGSDASLTKKGSDIVLIGNAYTNSGNRKWVDVSVTVGHINKTIRVFGDRRWYRSLGSWRASQPIPFDKMPLLYEKAFGGKDLSHTNPARHGLDKRNPVGTGFCVSDNKKHLEGLPLPNLEDPRAYIKSWKDKPNPACFGFIGHDWLPRVKYAGTYDETWQKERCPLLPGDFDDSFFNSAHPDLTSDAYFKGGETVQVVNASRSGNVSFYLPRISFDISMWIKGKKKVHVPKLDTIIIEPDDLRVIVVWRATVPCFREFLYIDSVRIKETKDT